MVSIHSFKSQELNKTNCISEHKLTVSLILVCVCISFLRLSPLCLSPFLAPCPPTNVSAVLNCTTLNALVSWRSSAAATFYTVQATSMNGHNSSCSEMGTSCILNDLVCGQDYSVVVGAMHEGCPGPSSVPARLTTGASTSDLGNIRGQTVYYYILQTKEQQRKGNTMRFHVCLPPEPCAPTNLSILYNMSTAQVTWGAARGAGSYWVQAVTGQGSTVTCNSTNTSCSLNGLQCSRIYNVSVTARNLDCDSTIAETRRLVTGASSDRDKMWYIVRRSLILQCVCVCVCALRSEPCPSTNVQASMSCEQLSATVSWQQSDLAVGYVAYFDNQEDHNASCVGSDADAQCVVSGLMCGTVYNVWVKVLGWQNTSSDSTVTTLTSGEDELNMYDRLHVLHKHQQIYQE